MFCVHTDTSAFVSVCTCLHLAIVQRPFNQFDESIRASGRLLIFFLFLYSTVFLVQLCGFPDT